MIMYKKLKRFFDFSGFNTLTGSFFLVLALTFVVASTLPFVDMLSFDMWILIFPYLGIFCGEYFCRGLAAVSFLPAANGTVVVSSANIHSISMFLLVKT